MKKDDTSGALKKLELNQETLSQLKFNEQGLLPAIIQEANTNEVLMMAWMDKECFIKARDSGKTWFFSRSRNKYWQKGETSNNVQKIVEIWADCDFDVVLIKVSQEGTGACHTGSRTCFFNNVLSETH